MKSASLELCEELYRISGWEPSQTRDNAYFWWHNPYKVSEPLYIPKYNLGYMRDMIYKRTPQSMVDVVESNFSKALFLGEDATAEFAIKLFEQEILKREEAR